jgi:hypothetical protein
VGGVEDIRQKDNHDEVKKRILENGSEGRQRGGIGKQLKRRISFKNEHEYVELDHGTSCKSWMEGRV